MWTIGHNYAKHVRLHTEAFPCGRPLSDFQLRFKGSLIESSAWPSCEWDDLVLSQQVGDSSTSFSLHMSLHKSLFHIKLDILTRIFFLAITAIWCVGQKTVYILGACAKKLQ